jgi:hypothetical protein
VSPLFSRARPRVAEGVFDHLLVDDVGQPAFDAPHGLHGALPSAFLRS